MIMIIAVMFYDVDFLQRRCDNICFQTISIALLIRVLTFFTVFENICGYVIYRVQIATESQSIKKIFSKLLMF